MESTRKNNTVKELFERLKQEKTDSEMQEIERDKIMDKLINYRSGQSRAPAALPAEYLKSSIRQASENRQ